MLGIPGVASPEGELSSSSSSRWHSYILIAVLKHPEFLNTLKSSSWNILKHSEIIILKHPEILKHSEIIWEIFCPLGDLLGHGKHLTSPYKPKTSLLLANVHIQIMSKSL